MSSNRDSDRERSKVDRSGAICYLSGCRDEPTHRIKWSGGEHWYGICSACGDEIPVWRGQVVEGLTPETVTTHPVATDGGSSGNSREYQANEVRKILDGMPEMDHTGHVPETIEGFAKQVVEGGTFWPDCRVTADLSLTLRERVTGKREQDVTAMLCIGLVLGSALERDVPTDGTKEDVWKEGRFELPERSLYTGESAENQQEGSDHE